jgi:UDP-GlcNAc:undecaprenyl-phosphate/decaprenyl-phosphate GlcNAc-1-phosphate transferase
VLPSSAASNGRRVLIYGAGDAGELLLRELLNNRELSYAPVGFMDDDATKHGKLIHGYRVFGGNGLLPSILSQHSVEQVLISTPRISPERIAEIWSECEAHNIELKRLSIRLEPISDNPLDSVPRISANGDL